MAVATKSFRPVISTSLVNRWQDAVAARKAAEAKAGNLKAVERQLADQLDAELGRFQSAEVGASGNELVRITVDQPEKFVAAYSYSFLKFKRA